MQTTATNWVSWPTIERKRGGWAQEGNKEVPRKLLSMFHQKQHLERRLKPSTTLPRTWRAGLDEGHQVAWRVRQTEIFFNIKYMLSVSCRSRKNERCLSISTTVISWSRAFNWCINKHAASMAIRLITSSLEHTRAHLSTIIVAAVHTDKRLLIRFMREHAPFCINTCSLRSLSAPPPRAHDASSHPPGEVLTKGQLSTSVRTHKRPLLPRREPWR